MVTYEDVKRECESKCIADPKCKAFKYDYSYCDFFNQSSQIK